MRLFIGNKAYSSWSMRGWLAARQSGLPFEEVLAPLYDADWDSRRLAADYAPSAGKVPILWDGDIAVWDSLAIIDYLAEKTDRDLFWPVEPAARAFARSISAEMHAGYSALRADLTMNVRRTFPAGRLRDETRRDIDRIQALWAEARDRFGGGGDFLFGAFGAADIMFAPVVTRFATYSVPLSDSAASYSAAVLAHPSVRDWLDAGRSESWVIDKFEHGPRSPSDDA